MAPHLPCALALPRPSHRDAAQTCWAPHFITQERLTFSNPTPSEPHLFPTATMSDNTLSAPIPPLHCASSLQPATPRQVVAFESWTISAPFLHRFYFYWVTETRSLNLCVCFYLFLFCLCFSDRNDLQLQVPVRNLVLIITAISLLL